MDAVHFPHTVEVSCMVGASISLTATIFFFAFFLQDAASSSFFTCVRGCLCVMCPCLCIDERHGPYMYMFVYILRMFFPEFYFVSVRRILASRQVSLKCYNSDLFRKH